MHLNLFYYYCKFWQIFKISSSNLALKMYLIEINCFPDQCELSQWTSQWQLNAHWSAEKSVWTIRSNCRQPNCHLPSFRITLLPSRERTSRSAESSRTSKTLSTWTRSSRATSCWRPRETIWRKLLKFLSLLGPLTSKESSLLLP